jgi:hypothetical protein
MKYYIIKNDKIYYQKMIKYIIKNDKYLRYY